MKKEVVLTVRVDAEIDKAVRAIAQEDERTVAWVARKLITEALEARGLLEPSPVKIRRQPKSKQ